MKKCKFQNCAVCQEIKQRKLFNNILKERCPDIYICEHAAYQVMNSRGIPCTFYNLEYIQVKKGVCYIKDPYTGEIINIKKENFLIICAKDPRACCKEPETQTYKKDG